MLKVSNPYDAAEMAQGLTRFYESEARELELEQAGMPFYRVETVRPTTRDSEGPVGAELQQAKDDVDRDFNALLHNPLLKDVYPELSGWRSAIGSVIAEGVNAARFALDPRQRDQTFSARRQLNEYARIIRFVGALTPDLNQYYRRLAQSLDEVANVMLVMTGEALASIGFSGGTFLLQTPASELHARRDAVIMALRNLIGTVQYAHGAAEWPHGLEGYRRLIDHLDRSGQTDLRALLDEATLVRLMDNVLDLATSNNADSLRALGSTAMPVIERFRRLVRTAESIADLDSPPLSAFEMALDLFCNSFVGARSGVRLLSIARPAILSYGLLGLAAPDRGTERLKRIVMLRNELAQLLDCYLGCSCDVSRLRGQIILDKILADVDQAINFYCAGATDEAEIRSAAYGCLIATVLRYAHIERIEEKDPQIPRWPPSEKPAWLPQPETPLSMPTVTTTNVLSRDDPRIKDEFLLGNISLDTKTAISNLTSQLSNVFLNSQLSNVFLNSTDLPDFVARSLPMTLLNLARDLLDGLQQPTISGFLPELLSTSNFTPNPDMPPIGAANQPRVVEMLSMQEDAEAQWANLLSTMAPSCHLPDELRKFSLHLIWLTRLEWCAQARAKQVDIEIPPTTDSVLYRSGRPVKR